MPLSGFYNYLEGENSMSFRHSISATNLLLDALSDQDCEQFLSHCEHVELVFAEELYQVGEPILYVYFPTGGFISLLTPLTSNSSNNGNLEVGMIGNEGMFGVSLILGVNIAPFKALVQGSGSALRMTAAAFLQELEQCPALHKELKQYLYVVMSQLTQTAACNHFHVVEERLARWLLMTQDRAHSDRFHVTHVVLAYILGVRRVGITKAANSLQKQKLISYHRGDVTILNRAGLEAVSCKCYQADRDVYQQILG
jgi:CRP-like cAMP-binding protein